GGDACRVIRLVRTDLIEKGLPGTLSNERRRESDGTSVCETDGHQGRSIDIVVEGNLKRGNLGRGSGEREAAIVGAHCRETTLQHANVPTSKAACCPAQVWLSQV